MQTSEREKGVMLIAREGTSDSLLYYSDITSPTHAGYSISHTTFFPYVSCFSVQHQSLWEAFMAWQYYISLHPLVTDFKLQIYVPPSPMACGVSTRDNICCTLSATQNRSV